MRRNPALIYVEIKPTLQQPSGVVAIWLLLLAFFCTGFGTPRLVDRDIPSAGSFDVSQLRALATARQIPELTSQATLLYDVDADQILLAQNERISLPVASLTKLMTTLLVLETATQNDGLLNEEVTIQAKDLVGGATMSLAVGERRTVLDLLYGILIPSGNDAANAIARHLGDSGLLDVGSVAIDEGRNGVGVFVERMNQRAGEMGMTQTNFVNPHGIDAEGHLSSAADLLILTKTLLNYAQFRQIVQLEEVEIGGRTLQNTNQLLGDFLGADGLKTGTTPASGESLIASITRNGHQVVMVILGSSGRYDDARELYRFYEENFVWSSELVHSYQALNRIYDGEGQLWYIAAEGERPARLLSAPAALPVTIFRRIQSPPPTQIWFQGMRIGFIEWRHGDELIGTQTLVLR